MDNLEYKQAKQKWNVKRRSIISDTMQLIKGLNDSLYTKLQRSIEAPPIEKPPSHTGGIDSDFFVILLSEEEAQELIDLLFDLEAAAVPQGDGIGFEKEAMQAREASRIASLVNDWNKLNA